MTYFTVHAESKKSMEEEKWLGHLKAIDASGTTAETCGKLHRLMCKSFVSGEIKMIEFIIAYLKAA
jgi:hypothetical protein